MEKGWEEVDKVHPSLGQRGLYYAYSRQSGVREEGGEAFWKSTRHLKASIVAEVGAISL